MSTKQTRKRQTKAAVPEVVNEDEPIVKKGRGRPPKRKEEEENKEEVVTKMDVEENGDDDEAEVEVTAPKRGRGRAKKNAQTAASVDVKEKNAEIDEEEKDKKEPRPKRNTRTNKVKQEVENDSQQNDVAVPRSRRGKRNTRKEENADDDQQATTTAAAAADVHVKKEEEDADDNQPTTTATGVQVKKEEDNEDKQAPAAPKNSKKGKKGKGKSAAKDDASKETEEEASTSQKIQGGKKSKASGKKKTTSGKENTDSSNIPQKSGAERVVIVKGRAAVDALCPIAATSHVYDEDDDVWDCMLNQTNIQFNNNKFYLMQLLEDDSQGTFSVWMRWGRVGANGQKSLQPCATNLDKAKNIFMKKFSDKTKNDWDMRDVFEKVPGKYDMLSMDYSKGEDTPDIAEAAKKSQEKSIKIESKLEAHVRALIEMICDVRTMEETVVEMSYDAKKAPLGKLTTEQIKAGYLALKKIDTLIQKGSYKSQDLVQACNDFYTRIPHYFGMKVPPLIRTNQEIRAKMALLEALGDIQAALSVLGQPTDSNLHPVDQQYFNLKCDLTLLEKECGDFKIIEKYLQTTHAKTHNTYSLEVLEVFSCHKEGEHERFSDVGNRMLLWHGSRLSNWAGILSQSLRIAPPEAPSTGYMFGKGIYFADMASKSANYCWATQRNNVGFLLLCDVSLGKINNLYHADYNAHKLPSNCHSVKGCGITAPVDKNFTKLSDGTVVPMGPGVKVTGASHANYSLLYNEYIVYNVNQVLTRYLIKVKFNFKT
ncbi:hypothetical protein Pmani_004716 [Petrolisthes manimaculis]|uniref:Poly [ADP-ribose] polymerase n=1 Tax=Petrolisthes manimaculis TaxID=1843537 RepID=A0AAE1QGC7_9EUCA|nr:hypothetical protein Pmani_004716 [Petrolisthes manimaculis]